MHFSIFGLSGVGKTTFIENACLDKHFFQPRQTVTRAPRSDDNSKKFQYLSKEAFNKLKNSHDFFIEDCEGPSYYGYLKKSLKLKINRASLLYGLPTKVDKIKSLGGISILIIGDAQKGLEMRQDSLPLRQQRSQGNRALQEKYFSNPFFLEKMDLILTNEIGQMEKILILFKIFAKFKKAEMGVLRGSLKSLLQVLKVYQQPLQGMRYDFLKHKFFVEKAFRDETLSLNFYSNVIQESRFFLKYFSAKNTCLESQVKL